MRKILGSLAMAGVFILFIGLSLAPSAQATMYGFNYDQLGTNGVALINDISPAPYPGFTFGNGVRGITIVAAHTAWGSGFDGIKDAAGLYSNGSGIFSIWFPDLFVGLINFEVAFPGGNQYLSINGSGPYYQVGCTPVTLTAFIDDLHTLTLQSGSYSGNYFNPDEGNAFTFDNARQVPLPGALLLLSSGLLCLANYGRRHRDRGST